MFNRTMLMQTECTEGRSVIGYFMCLVYSDEGVELARSKPHIVVFAPDAVYEDMRVSVNADLANRMNWPEIDLAEWGRAVAHCEIEHTPEVKVAYDLFKEKTSLAGN